MIIHKKRVVLIIGILLVVAALGVGIFFLMNQKSANTMHVVGSVEGAATLAIPESALPEEISLSDISITKLAPREYPDTLAGLGQLAVYRLEPDGLVLNEPVSFSITLGSASRGTSVPVILHIQDRKVEMVPAEFSLDAAGTATLTGNIKHFSSIVVMRGFFDLEVPETLGEHYIGESFVFPVTISKHDTFTFLTRDPGTKEEEVITWTLESDPILASGHYDGPVIVDPSWISDVPSDDTVLGNTPLSITGTFTCRYPGTKPLEYENLVRYSQTMEDSSESYFTSLLFGSVMDTGMYIRAQSPVTCKQRPPEPPPVSANPQTSTPTLPKPKTEVPPPPPSLPSTPQKDANPQPEPVQDLIGVVQPEPMPVVPTPVQKDICCYNAKAPVGERYYIPFDGSGCLSGDKQVPLDKDCGNPLFY